MNIMTNFVLHKKTNINPAQPEWINIEIKNMLKKENWLQLDLFRIECYKTIEKLKQNFLLNLVSKLVDKQTSESLTGK